jgi:hypothetical protein
MGAAIGNNWDAVKLLLRQGANAKLLNTDVCLNFKIEEIIIRN